MLTGFKSDQSPLFAFGRGVLLSIKTTHDESLHHPLCSSTKLEPPLPPPRFPLEGKPSKLSRHLQVALLTSILLLFFHLHSLHLLVAMASNLPAMASNPRAMASRAMASNLLVMASNLRATSTCYGFPKMPPSQVSTGPGAARSLGGRRCRVEAPPGTGVGSGRGTRG